MKKFYFLLLIILLNNGVQASEKDKIIDNLKNIKNIVFNFEQNINDKIEKGKCTIQYPKKIFCKYNSANQKTLVSDGKLLAIKTLSSYYLYSLKQTPLEFILDKEFLIKRINSANQRLVDEKYINFKFIENQNEINLFFDKKNFNLIGWQTKDIYQNLSITFLNSIIKNQKLKKGIFQIPERG